MRRDADCRRVEVIGFCQNLLNRPRKGRIFRAAKCAVVRRDGIVREAGVFAVEFLGRFVLAATAPVAGLLGTEVAAPAFG